LKTLLLCATGRLRGGRLGRLCPNARIAKNTKKLNLTFFISSPPFEEESHTKSQRHKVKEEIFFFFPFVPPCLCVRSFLPYPHSSFVLPHRKVNAGGAAFNRYRGDSPFAACGPDNHPQTVTTGGYGIWHGAGYVYRIGIAGANDIIACVPASQNCHYIIVIIN
jgi:hypothetical protein